MLVTCFFSESDVIVQRDRKHALLLDVLRIISGAKP